MSFIGAVGKLLKNSGLLPWFKSVFGDAEKMLLGKKFPMNVRTLHFAKLEVFKGPNKSSGMF